MNGVRGREGGRVGGKYSVGGRDRVNAAIILGSVDSANQSDRSNSHHRS